MMECLVMAGCWLLRVLFHSISTTLSRKATFHVLGTIRKRCADKLGRISLGDAQKRPSGELKNTMVERIDSIETALAHIMPEFTSNPAGSLCILIYLFVIDWHMALVSLITLPIGMMFFMGMMAGYEKSYRRIVTAVKDLNDSTVEYIDGIEVIKIFGKTKSSCQRFLAAAREGAASYIDWIRSTNFFFCFSLVILPATLLTVLPIDGLFVRAGTLSVENFIMVLILSLG